MSILDTRDLAATLDDLEERDDLEEDEIEELEQLRELEQTLSEFHDGAQMIPEDEFEDYARQLAEDVGAMPDTLVWPLTCIDWEQAAHELSQDYTSVDYDGVSYYVHSC